MKRQTFQHPELRDANDNIIQEGTYGKASPLVNGDNTGVLDYINNNLEALYDNLNGSRIYVANKDALPATGDLSAMYIAEDTGKWYLWNGSKYIETDNARKIADEAIAARDAAKASQTAAKTSEQNAKTSESNAAASKTAAATSATNAANSATSAGTQANTAKAWATATTSPDNAADTASTTGKTQSAKSWAMYSKDRATAAASSASAAAGSASAAKTSETNAASSKTAAETSATNAANSAKAAAYSATAAANSAREQQADWNVTDTNSKAFVKNKPAVYPKAAKVESEAPVDTPTDLVYAKCGTSDRFRIRVGGAENAGWVELATGDDNAEPIYVRQYEWNTSDSQKDYYFGALVREAVLLDASGNTSFPGTITATNLSTTSLTVTGTTSVPTANAGNSSKAIANTEFVAKSIAALVNGAPDQLNTLNELAKALGNDSNFAATVTAELAKKLNSTEAESTYATKQEARVLPGTVTAFSGTFNDGYPIDKNTGLADKRWHLCDGTNGTPDLRNRFIYGGDGTNNGATGGEASHKLTEAELPNITGDAQFRLLNGSHNIVSDLNDDPKQSGAFSYNPSAGSRWTGTMQDGPSSARNADVLHLAFGGNQPHNNMPPYYVLSFIMKL
jgi:microcystin-dependent protein